MNYITILTPDNIEIKYRLAGTGSRIAAAVIDFLIQGAAIAIIAVIYYFTIYRYGFALADISLGAAIVILLMFCVIFIYYILIEVLLDGRTIGKKLLGLRVIRENGSAIGISQSLIRNVLKLTIDLICVGIITIFFSKKNKRVGDYAASTVVIACDKQTFELNAALPDSTISQAAPLNNKLIMDDREYRLLKDYFNRRESFADNGLFVWNAFAAYFGKKFNIPSDMFTERVLKWMLYAHLRG